MRTPSPDETTWSSARGHRPVHGGWDSDLGSETSLYRGAWPALLSAYVQPTGSASPGRFVSGQQPSCPRCLCPIIPTCHLQVPFPARWRQRRGRRARAGRGRLGGAPRISSERNGSDKQMITELLVGMDSPPRVFLPLKGRACMTALRRFMDSGNVSRACRGGRRLAPGGRDERLTHASCTVPRCRTAGREGPVLWEQGHRCAKRSEAVAASGLVPPARSSMFVLNSVRGGHRPKRTVCGQCVPQTWLQLSPAM